MKKKWVCGILIALSICLVALMIFAYNTGKYGKANTLIAAIRAEGQEKVELLLQSGVDPNQTDVPISKYWTFFESTATRPLTVACSTKNLEIVKLLIEYGATAETIEYTDNPLRQMIFTIMLIP